MEVKLTHIQRQFKTPIVVAGIRNQLKDFLEGTINGKAFELSVLPGLHQESFEEACDELNDFFKHQDLSKVTLPSVRFSLEAWLYTAAHSKTPVKSNALLLTPEISKLAELRSQGYECFKIKIARGESAHELKEFLSNLNQHERVRLDGNRLLTPDQLKHYLDVIKDFWPFIDYIEEPFATLKEHQLWSHTIALALDESVLLDQQGFQKHVLKPALLGFNEAISLIEKWAKLGHQTTVSSSFEGPIGLSWLNTLANLQNSFSPNPAGLGTLEYFA